MVDALIDFPKPLLALVNGPAIGIGTTMLGLCDYVVASDSATFNTPFTFIGLTPEGCSSHLLPKIIGTSNATAMLLFNRKFSAHQVPYWLGLKAGLGLGDGLGSENGLGLDNGLSFRYVMG
jgi:enoyl-CoA hydratase/carnithine racemase